ncbi:ParB N-terminal domain-containing protein [Flavivirga jejuensis]|uniref:ParB N-terminal domain-containing protein n=1 Tax=Flavivirga jejuensis TaxID=870487 RepID=A0ABT8WL58_9FLAO|nr:ParB N-terminal domain-containing protein [Flavivirga jejuensis]MDO5973853.1 ParB N-terminal domain-containing protein [Flavivirga jejuensis]
MNKNKSIEQDILKLLRKTRAIPEAKKEGLIDDVLEMFRGYKEPVSKVVWVPIKAISPNSYNPNKMAAPEKRLLLRSMLDHGITLPLVVSAEKEQGYILIDGYHRWTLIKRSKELKDRLNRRVPVVILEIPDYEGIIATIRHNRARGRHQIAEISEVVKILSDEGLTSANIMEALGMDADEVLRLKQFKGLGELFKDEDYSLSWNADAIENKKG